MSCAAPLVVASPVREVRKVVTALFCDVVGSTALGEQTDPEALRALLGRYFERMSGIVESHGGTVEKFIGDAVLAVFGVPHVHEDDALRACRAAVEMRDALPGLGIRGRIGVNTGEVVTGTAERLVTGDAVNVAARFEQAAGPGEVLVGASTYELVQGAVDAEPVEPLVLKGKSGPVAAFRLLAAHAASERRHDSLFVGRERELGLLSEAWERAAAGQRCELVTVVGEPGIGKSRLVAEALASIGARVVRGRCLPYGAGITYWPVVEVIKQLDLLPTDPAAAAALRSLLGEGDGGTSAEEVGWAFRKLLEEQAPLVVVFDDIQWAEQSFLDLIEHVALLSSGAPLLLLCMARPELLDSRPTWPVTTRLEPLGDADAESLIGPDVPEELRSRIAAAAAGNPLFISEMLAMTQRAGDHVEVPASLKALLAARLDQLDPAERRVLECGSVEGEVFHRSAVQALTPEEKQVTPRLAALVRRELIRSDRPQFADEDGFRFRHLLIRDTAYDALTKATRAELHERFAHWLEERGEDLVELDEILGYHLEQAALYRRELRQPDDALAERAGVRLAAAGRRALWRGDERAAAGLIERALVLTRPARLDVVLELDLGQALSGSSPQAAAALADAAAERARSAGDETAEALARLGAAYFRVFFEDDPAIDEVETLVRAALPLLEKAEDHAGLAYAWDALTMGVFNWRCHFEDYAHAAEQARHHAQLAGQRRSKLFRLDHALVYGPRPADEALRTIDELLPANPHPSVLLVRAWLLTMLANCRRGSTARERRRPAVARTQRRRRGRLDARLHRADKGRPRDRRCLPPPLLRLRRDGKGRVSPDLCASPRPLALRARPLRRSRASRSARSHPRQDRRRRLHASTLATGAGARPHAPRPPRGGGGPRPRGGRRPRTDGRVEHARRRALRSRRGACHGRASWGRSVCLSGSTRPLRAQADHPARPPHPRTPRRAPGFDGLRHKPTPLPVWECQASVRPRGGWGPRNTARVADEEPVEEVDDDTGCTRCDAPLIFLGRKDFHEGGFFMMPAVVATFLPDRRLQLVCRTRSKRRA